MERFRPVGGPDPAQFTVLFVGTVSVRKGVPYLLEGFKAFSHPNKRLRVVGPISPEMAGYLRRLADDRISYEGALPNRELPARYSSADAMVLPSVEEGLALVIGEALACGCPVIATPNTGASNLFDHGREGLLVDVQSSAAVRDALQRFADCPEEATAMRGRARERIVRIGGWDAYGARWQAIIENDLGLTPSKVAR